MISNARGKNLCSVTKRVGLLRCPPEERGETSSMSIMVNGRRVKEEKAAVIKKDTVMA